MAFPTNAEELDKTLGIMQSKGASKDEMRMVVNEFRAQQSKPVDTIANTQSQMQSGQTPSAPDLVQTATDLAIKGGNRDQAIKAKLQEATNPVSTAVKGVAKAGAEFGQGAVAEAGGLIGNVAKWSDYVNPVSLAEFGMRKLGKEATPTFGETTSKGAEYAKQSVKDVSKAGGFDPESTASKFGAGTMDAIGVTLASIYGAEAAGGIMGAIMRKLAPSIAETTAGVIAQNVPVAAAKGYGAATGFTAPLEGRTPTIGEAATATGLNAILESVFPVVKALRSAKTSRADKLASSKIQEMITPKMTQAEKTSALEQGRLTKGKETWLGGKKPDIVAPSPKTIKIEEVVRKYIPEEQLATIDQPTLYTKAKESVSSISQNLKPKLQEITVNPESFKQVKDEWKNLKIKQSKSLDFKTMPGGKAAQTKFQETLNEIKKITQDSSGKFRSKNLDDIWDLAIKYDDTIPQRIKDASVAKNSSPSDMFQKDMWLENRDLLKKFMHVEADRAGLDTSTAFKDMSSLYDLTTNLKGTVKVDLKGKPGLLKKGAKIVGGAAAAGLGIKGASSLID